MTTRELTKKIHRLEQELLQLHREVVAQRHLPYAQTVWERTRGVISSEKSQAWIRRIKQDRQKADRALR